MRLPSHPRRWLLPSSPPRKFRSPSPPLRAARCSQTWESFWTSSWRPPSASVKNRCSSATFSGSFPEPLSSSISWSPNPLSSSSPAGTSLVDKWWLSMAISVCASQKSSAACSAPSFYRLRKVYMSITSFAIDPQASQEDFSPPRSRDRWWAHLLSRCARPDCPHRHRLWPTRLRKTTGITFDGRWYCELLCLQPLLEYRLRNLLSASVLQKSRAYRLPLGLLLVDGGAISPDLLRETLRLQREGGTGRIGDWLLQTGAISEQQLSVALAQQWGCPVFPLRAQHLHPSWSTLVPF